MDRSLTVMLMAAAVTGAVFCGWRGARAPDPNRGPRLVPWRPLMVGFFVLVLLLLIHLVKGGAS